MMPHASFGFGAAGLGLLFAGPKISATTAVLAACEVQWPSSKTRSMRRPAPAPWQTKGK
jgi:hypothetical protein